MFESEDVAYPVSAGFIDFLAFWLERGEFDGQQWADQTKETLKSRFELRFSANMRLQRLIMNESAQRLLERARALADSVKSGNQTYLRELHRTNQFMVIVGAPRTGGSYLTAELFSSLGYEPSAVPTLIAHDGFPEAEPFDVQQWCSRLPTQIATLGEYLTATEVFFDSQRLRPKRIIPKKATKLVYSNGLLQMAFGRSAKYFVTVRNPLASCISTYEKSGGLPEDGRFSVRSAIERWILRDNLLSGKSRRSIMSSDYFDVYLNYWEQFYIRLAMSALAASRLEIVPFGKQPMETTARRFHDEFSSRRAPSVFITSDGAVNRHPLWEKKAKEAIERVAIVWGLMGLRMPVAELLLCT